MAASGLGIEIDAIVRRALEEDIGDGDVTTLCTMSPETMVMGRFLVKAAGVVAGLDVVRAVFARLDGRVRVSPRFADGDAVEARTVVAEISGPGRAVLSGERVALNFLQRLSGIATLTRRFVDAVRGTQATILDTRKTAPGLRALDKWAVRLGGGQNHRMGLYDMVLIKDNHIAAVGSITDAVARVRAGDPRRRPIEVEVTTLAELEEALGLDVDRIMLDNMSPDDMRLAVQIVGGRVPLEASGGVRLDTVAAIAATGVDYISVGAITHSISALDISLDLDTPMLPRGAAGRPGLATGIHGAGAPRSVASDPAGRAAGVPGAGAPHLEARDPTEARHG
jgi:nicotinate-nucleotide pyrophosphorylase (carboxylating)